jgi:thiol-disulfide isomerase/thioredoxin
MRTLYILSLLFCLSVFHVKAQSVSWHSGNFEDAINKAKSDNKYVFVDCYTDWCTWCKVMDKETFTDPQTSDFMNNQFISLKLDMEKPEQAELGAKYRVRIFPSFLVFNSEGTLVYRIHGFRKAPDLMHELNKAMDPAQQMKFPGISDAMNPGFPPIYMQQFGTNKRPAGMKAAETDAFLSARKDLFDEVSWAVMSTFPLTPKYDAHFLNNINAYRENFGLEADLLFDRMIGILMQKVSESKNEQQLDSVLRLIDAYGKDDIEGYKKYILKDFYFNTQNWEKLLPILEGLWADAGTDNNQVNSDCWNLYENCKDENLLQQAMMRMQRVADEDPQYAYLDTHAALLFKLSHFEDAQRYAEMAIQTGKEAGEDVKETEALLAKIVAAKK